MLRVSFNSELSHGSSYPLSAVHLIGLKKSKMRRVSMISSAPLHNRVLPNLEVLDSKIASGRDKIFARNLCKQGSTEDGGAHKHRRFSIGHQIA